MSGPYEWRINDIERAANEATRRLHELDAIRSNVDRVECALRESRAEADGLRRELETASQRIEQLEAQMSEVLSFISNSKISGCEPTDSTKH
jgi:predicted  nucleic acid-binding Zn-ribbon protein